MVCGEEDGDCTEVEVDSDGTVSLSSIATQFTGTTGLKYRNPDTQGWRLVRCAGDALQAPKEGWQEHVAYLCVRPFDKNMESKPAATKKKMPFDNIDTSFGNGGGMNGNGMGMNGNGMGMNGGGMGMNGNGMGMNGNGMGMNGGGMGMNGGGMGMR